MRWERSSPFLVLELHRTCHAMKIPLPLPISLAAAILGSTPTLGQVSVLAATPQGLEVRFVDAGAVSIHPTLTGLDLLPFAPAGHLRLEELQPDRARIRRGVAGATRLALPQEQGTLYHFRRTAPGGTVDFGYFLVRGAEPATELLSLPGTGPAQDTDPFLATAAVARGGARALVATHEEAGGDLYALDLARATGELLTPTLDPQSFHAHGLALLDGFALASTTDSVLRWSAGEPAPVTFPDAPIWFQGDVAVSNNALRGVTLAGAEAGMGVPYVIGPSGPAARGSAAPMAAIGASFAPGPVTGPTLAVSDDGHACAWTVQEGTKEVFLSTAVVPAPKQITVDDNYVDTLDQAGVLFFNLLGALVMTVGESGGDEDVIESVDVYTIESLPEGEVLTNVSLTSGEMATPFPKGEIDPENGIFRMPASDVLLTHDSDSSGQGSVLAVDPQSPGATVLLSDAKQLDWVESVGSTVLYSVLRDLAASRELHRWVVGGDPEPLFALPEDVEFDVIARSPGGWLALRATLLDQQWLARMHVASGQTQLLASAPLHFGRDAWFGPDEGLHFTALVGTTAFLVEWPPAGAPGLSAPAPFVGGVLPGFEGF